MEHPPSIIFLLALHTIKVYVIFMKASFRTVSTIIIIIKSLELSVLKREKDA